MTRTLPAGVFLCRSGWLSSGLYRAAGVVLGLVLGLVSGLAAGLASCLVLGLLLVCSAPGRAQSLPDAPAPRPATNQAANQPAGAGSTAGATRGDDTTRKAAKAGRPAADSSTSASPGAAKSASDDNAFPEEESKQAAATEKPKDVPETRTSDRSEPPATSAGDKKNAADDNPFPEDKSEAAARAANPDSEIPKGEPGRKSAMPDVSSSGKSTDAAASVADLPKQGDAAAVADPKRAAKDLQVGKYYLDARDYKGAYARFKEAISLNPEDPEVAFALAESARKLNRLDEAVANYKLCLQLDPDGPKAKPAKRALAEFDKVASR